MGWNQSHRLVHAWLTTGDKARLTKTLEQRGQSLAQWIMGQVDACEAERVPQTNGCVRPEVPVETAVRVIECLRIEADRHLTLADLAKRLGAPKEVVAERRRAGMYLDDLALFSRALERSRWARHLIESGIKPIIHRIGHAGSGGRTKEFIKPGQEPGA